MRSKLARLFEIEEPMSPKSARGQGSGDDAVERVLRMRFWAQGAVHGDAEVIDLASRRSALKSPR